MNTVKTKVTNGKPGNDAVPYSHLSTATLQNVSASASDAINEAMKKAN